MLTVSNLNTAYGNEVVLKNVSFSLNSGEILAIIGPNGSGKTTLLKSVLGIKEDVDGAILINGCTPKNFLRKFKGKIGYVPQHQNINLLLPLTVFDVVSQNYRAKNLFGFLNQQEKKAILQALEMVNLLEKKDELFINLSGGQRQKALLALAISGNPNLLFLDEPTSALDISSIQQIYQILLQLKKKGMGILIVSHDVSAIVSKADNILVLMNEMKFYGSPQDVSEDVIHNVFGSHIKIIPNDPNCDECSYHMGISTEE